eukprot:2873070-Rhodomonas_salina.1
MLIAAVEGWGRQCHTQFLDGGPRVDYQVKVAQSSPPAGVDPGQIHVGRTFRRLVPRIPSCIVGMPCLSIHARRRVVNPYRATHHRRHVGQDKRVGRGLSQDASPRAFRAALLCQKQPRLPVRCASTPKVFSHMCPKR